MWECALYIEATIPFRDLGASARRDAIRAIGALLKLVLPSMEEVVKHSSPEDAFLCERIGAVALTL